MLLQDYKLEILNSKCQPGAMSVHCFAHLEQDVSEALPYLNAVIGGFEYMKDPPAVIFKSQGKLITVHGKKIAINALKDEAEAVKIVEWLKKEINEAWENKNNIEPCYQGTPKPKIIEILKLLPKTNCKECGEPTCMVFATRIAEGAKGIEKCPSIGAVEKEKLQEYMKNFKMDAL
ncbi:MAG: Fe-S cluster protein [Desulfobacterales bacterium]|nr:Fe-S cluster protein [Desulfobacterales bacterium]